ncbi:MAG: diguanylate cyclase, partial [Candidatus Hydrogenedentes bacterium]|nr:diguanylate cyclase [Candidatus Hydrogenedentota bacterium]
IMEVSLREDASLRDLAEVVALDPALSAKVLRTVNSAFYGFSHEITTLPHAISILGMKSVRNLSLGLMIVKEFSRPGAALSKLASRQLWKRALAAAVIAKKIGGLRDPQLAEEAFLIALLQDIGMLALMATAPKEYRNILKKNLVHGPVLCAAEQGRFEIDHMGAGSVLASKWNLPSVYQSCLGAHHRSINEIKGMSPDEILDKVVRFSAEAACLVTSGSDPLHVVRLQNIAEKHFSIDAERLETILSESHMNVVELGSIFEVPTSGLNRYADLLEQANQKLTEIGLSYEEALVRIEKERDEAKQLVETLEKHGRKLEHLAVRDELTGIYNRRALMENLALEMARSKRYKRPISAIMLDIDHFKRVNDTYGHGTGDAVLRHVASTIQKVVRETDVFGRYGGEEFVLVLSETGMAETKLLQERVRSAVDRAVFSTNEHRIHVTVSTGGSSFDGTDDSVTPELLLKRSDQALYQSKRSGRNRSSFVALSAGGV